jgi:hypothetical protein
MSSAYKILIRKSEETLDADGVILKWILKTYDSCGSECGSVVGFVKTVMGLWVPKEAGYLLTD